VIDQHQLPTGNGKTCEVLWCASSASARNVCSLGQYFAGVARRPCLRSLMQRRWCEHWLQTRRISRKTSARDAASSTSERSASERRLLSDSTAPEGAKISALSSALERFSSCAMASISLESRRWISFQRLTALLNRSRSPAKNDLRSTSPEDSIDIIVSPWSAP
jgi:hypothetical protein